MSVPDKTSNGNLARVEWILFSTAFAAGAVDIIGFTSLGGVFASAMTGNFALLAYHVAQGNWRSAIGSVIALIGFVTGCIIGFTVKRGRSARDTVNWLLGAETVLLLLFAGYSLWAMPLAAASATRLQIVILALAMGLQAVVGHRISQSTIVFTTTLTRLIGGITDSIATRSTAALREVRIQIALVAFYLLGALFAAILSVHRMAAGVFVPMVAVTVALVAQLWLTHQHPNCTESRVTMKEK
jgi:uncharacterized membrane protein YoaK (UPF0700 family)